MSKCPIGFGCSRWYLFVFGTAFFKLLKLLLFSISPYNNIGLFGFRPILSNHIFIQSFYKYISFIIGSLLFIYIINKNTKGETNSNNQKNKNIKLKGLIYNGKKDDLKKKTVIPTLLVCFIFFFHRESIEILYSFNFNLLDFWTFDFIFIYLFMNIYFVKKDYNHQTCSMIFIIVSNFILLIISSLLPMYNYGENGEGLFKGQNSYDIIKTITNYDYSFIPILFGYFFYLL